LQLDLPGLIRNDGALKADLAADLAGGPGTVPAGDGGLAKPNHIPRAEPHFAYIPQSACQAEPSGKIAGFA